jgi:hypothetical protein
LIVVTAARRLEVEALAGRPALCNILFSSLVGLMLQIVCKTQASVHAAYRHANIGASIVAVYGKLRGVELTTSEALVADIAGQARDLIHAMNGARPSLLPGYRLIWQVHKTVSYP